MTIINPVSVIADPNQTLNLSSLLQFKNGASLPTYIDVTLLDRHEYPHGFHPIYGSLVGNGQVITDYVKSVPGYFSNSPTDAIDTGCIFTLQSNGHYYNPTYGYFDQLQYIVSNTQFDSTYISVFGANSASTFTSLSASPGYYFLDPTSLAAYSAAGGNLSYLGSVDIVARADLANSIQTCATPSAITSSANTFVGQVWNDDGCWVLASNISTLAGASLPITTAGGATQISGDNTKAPLANGEWLVAYNGGGQLSPTIAQAESALRPGDIVTVYWSGGGGHIFTVVSGYGSNAMTIDNEQTPSNYVDLTDIRIIGAHSVNSELLGNGAIASTITVYRLDTPTITVIAQSNAISAGSSFHLSQPFSASDAGGVGSASITEYAFYTLGATGTAASDTIVVNGVTHPAGHSPDSATIVNATDLSSTNLQSAVGSGGNDTVYVSAYNGSYWGDWSSFNITESGSQTSVTQSNTNTSASTTFSIPLSSIQSIGLSPDGHYLLIKIAGVTQSVAAGASIAFNDSTVSTSDLINTHTAIPVFHSSGGTNGYALPDSYAGPASLGLKWQLIESADNAVVTGSSDNDFIKVSSTNSVGKAVNGGGGSDVIDGGVGSTFVTGGANHSDTFFLDGRAPGTSWSTITDFVAGTDKATIWGFVKGVSSIDTSFANFNNEGATGYQGLTLHFKNLLPDGQTSGVNANLNSITFSGHSLAELGASSLADLNNQINNGTNAHILVGSTQDAAGTHSYLYIH